MTALRKPENQLDLFVGKSMFGTKHVRDDIDLMSWPFFSLSKTPRTEDIDFSRQVGGKLVSVRVSGGKDGIATIWDNDILLYLRTMVIEALNRDEQPSREFVFSIHDCLRTIGRDTGGTDYVSFRASLQRLKTTTIFTNISADDSVEDQAVGYVESYAMRGAKKATGEIAGGSCKVRLTEWLYQMMLQSSRALAVDQTYFDLKGGVERKLYSIIRRHLGRQHTPWHIALEKLHEQTGVQMPLRHFKAKVASIIAADGLPGYAMKIEKLDRSPLAGKPGIVTVRRRATDVLIVTHAR